MCITRKSQFFKQTWVSGKSHQIYRLQRIKAQFCKVKLTRASLLPHYSLIWVEPVWTGTEKGWVISSKKPFLTKYLMQIAHWKKTLCSSSINNKFKQLSTNLSFIFFSTPANISQLWQLYCTLTNISVPVLSSKYWFSNQVWIAAEIKPSPRDCRVWCPKLLCKSKC